MITFIDYFTLYPVLALIPNIFILFLEQNSLCSLVM